MSKIPDAWDDDWETLADKQEKGDQEKPVESAKLTKAQLKARHQEANKQLWESAEDTGRPIFLEARDNVPLKSDFKPTVKVLSRKPPPKIASRGSATSGMTGLSLENDEDSEEEQRKRNEQTFAERQAKAQKEREEKQRKYQEVRERLFGSSSQGPEASSSRNESNASSRNSSRGKGRSRNDRDGTAASTDQSPARKPVQKRQLYDPGYASKPNSVYIQKREAANGNPSEASPSEEQPIRAPRGPDGSGRGGFGFAPRGNKTGSTA